MQCDAEHKSLNVSNSHSFDLPSPRLDVEVPPLLDMYILVGFAVSICICLIDSSFNGEGTKPTVHPSFTCRPIHQFGLNF